MKWAAIIPASRRRMREKVKKRGVERDKRWWEALSKLERISSSLLIFCFAFPLLFCLGGSLNWIKQPRLIKLGWMTFQWHRIQRQPRPIPLYIFDMVIEELMWEWLCSLFLWILCKVEMLSVVLNVVAIVRFLGNPIWILLWFECISGRIEKWMPERK